MLATTTQTQNTVKHVAKEQVNTRFYGTVENRLLAGLRAKDPKATDTIQVGNYLIKDVVVGPNKVEVNPSAVGNGFIVEGSPWLVKTALHIVTDAMAGVLEEGLERGCRIFNSEGTAQMAGIVNLQYNGPAASYISGLAEAKAELAAMPVNVQQLVKDCYLMIAKNGSAYVSRKWEYQPTPADTTKALWKETPQGRKALMENAILNRQKVLDMILTGKMVRFIFSDALAAQFVGAKYAQMNMTPEQILADKETRIGNMKDRGVLATGYALAAQQQEIASATGTAPVLPASLSGIKTINLIDDAGVKHPVNIDTIPAGTQMWRYENGLRKKTEIVVGDDQVSKILILVEAKAGIDFMIIK